MLVLAQLLLPGDPLARLDSASPRLEPGVVFGIKTDVALVGANTAEKVHNLHGSSSLRNHRHLFVDLLPVTAAPGLWLR